MRFAGIAVVLTTACMLAACVGGATPTMPQPVPKLTAPPTVQATVVTTHQNSGCDESIRGDCWLRLYNSTEMVGTPLNASTRPDAKCQMVDHVNDSAVTKAAKETYCWPQPGTQVTLVCKQTVNHEEWYGVQVPRDQVLTPPNIGTPSITGYAKAKYFNTVSTAALQSCA